jgi:bifunctional DNA-binding transcriptional regulator/antitoxin component of YhaV-PrlF toxin-antitoxin module
MIQTIKTATISSKRQITIPVEFNQFHAGSKALVIGKDNEIIIKPLKQEQIETAIMSEKSLAECWNSKEDEEAFAYLQDE